MISNLELSQFLYEFSMTIGSSLDLHKMLRCSLSTLLRKVGCSAGGVHLIRQEGYNKFWFEQVFSIPRNTGSIDEYCEALSLLKKNMQGKELAEFLSQLPISKAISAKSSFVIIELQGIGVMVLIKNGPQLDPFLLKALQPVFNKLADGCTSCLQSDELIEHRQNLEEMVQEKSAEILVKNKLLQEEIAENKRVNRENEKLIGQLQEALSNIKTLSGMLPICAKCKNIRDDKGYWNEIEVYIQNHSETLFSHSICPDCAAQLYGKQDWFTPQDKKE